MHTQERLVYYNTTTGYKVAFTKINPREIAEFKPEYHWDIKNIIIKNLQAGKYRTIFSKYHITCKIINSDQIKIRDGIERISVLDESIEARLAAQHQLTLKRHGTIQSMEIYSWNKRIDKRLESITISAKRLKWEILPPGWWNDKKYISPQGASESTLKPNYIERLKFIDSLFPQQWFQGNNYLGRRSYYVAVFRSFVIAESAQYGNAAYVVYDMANWQSLLSRPKRQVLQLGPKIVTRIRHVSNAGVRIATIVGKD